MYTFYTFHKHCSEEVTASAKCQKDPWHKEEERISHSECVHYRYKPLRYYWEMIITGTFLQKIPEDGDHPQSIVSCANANVDMTVSQG